MQATTDSQRKIQVAELHPLYGPTSMSAMAELETLKAYLRWRILRWLEQGEDRQQRDFAKMARMSPGHLSGILKGSPFSEEAATSIIDALGLSLQKALQEAESWKKTDAGRRQAQDGESPNLRSALEAFERGSRQRVSADVRAVLVAELHAKGDRSFQEWMGVIPGLMLVAEHSPDALARRVTESREVAEMTRPRSRRQTRIRKSESDR
jgi:hypothetical protein